MRLSLASRLGSALGTAVLASATLTAACAHAKVPVATGDGAPTAEELSEFWVDPTGQPPRSLKDGVGANLAKPVENARYDVKEVDPTGFSITYKLKDSDGMEWNVKIGPEARPEVVASRIVWALGYHQLPSFFVDRFEAVDKNGKKYQRGGARFRPKEFGMKSSGTWSWQRNRFAGTQPFNGLLVLMMLLNSTDLKDDNNEVYETKDKGGADARREFIVKDLGATLGATGYFDAKRGDLEAFEREPFIVGSTGSVVTFAFKGGYRELVSRISPADVKWMAARVMKITDEQWTDAFHAGHYDDEQTRRYVARIKQKASEGLAIR
jgi:hypothetical protein